MAGNEDIAKRALAFAATETKENIDYIKDGAEAMLRAALDFNAAGDECIKVIRAFRMAITSERKLILDALTDILDQIRLEKVVVLMNDIAQTMCKVNEVARDPGLVKMLRLLVPLINENNAQGASPAHLPTENDQ